MKTNKTIKTFEEYQKNIDDIFSKDDVEQADDVVDIKKSKSELEEEEEEEQESEMEEQEEEKVWGDEGVVESFKKFEAVSIDKEFALKDIIEFNKVSVYRFGDIEEILKKCVISIIKNLGFKDSESNINSVTEHITSSMNGELIPEDTDLISEIFDILNNNDKISEQYNKSEYFEQSEIDELKKLLPQLKQANSILNRQEIINWFNDNDIDYFNMTDMEMFIYYIENN